MSPLVMRVLVETRAERRARHWTEQHLHLAHVREYMLALLSFNVSTGV